MKKTIIHSLITTLLCVSFFAGADWMSTKIRDQKTKSATIVRGDINPIIELTNQAREEAGLNPLKEDGRLVISATRKACDMKDNDYFAHANLEGEKSWNLIESEGYSPNVILGENLTRNFNEKEAIEGWLRSKGHRENILNEKYTHIGVGRCENYLVQHFGGLKQEDQ